MRRSTRTTAALSLAIAVAVALTLTVTDSARDARPGAQAAAPPGAPAVAVASRSVRGTAVSRRVPAAGPALAGEHVVWGDERAGRMAVLRRRAGGPVRALYRRRRPTARRLLSGFSNITPALAASTESLAFVTVKGRCTMHGDVGVCSSTSSALGGPQAGPFRRLLPCESASAVTVDVDADAVALAVESGRCGDRAPTGIWVKEGAASARQVFDVDEDVEVHLVRLAGRLVAWTQGPRDEIVVGDHVTGQRLATLTPGDFGGGGEFDTFDLAQDGTIAALHGPQPTCMFVCVSWLRLDDRTPRQISRRAGDGALALAGGRIAWLAMRQSRAHTVAVSTLDGRLTHRFDRFGRRRHPAGDLALTPSHLAWGVARVEPSTGGNLGGEVRVARLDAPG